MLQPKRTKFRKMMKGRNRGLATGMLGCLDVSKG
jgi:ribosomal protein L16/L10AE